MKRSKVIIGLTSTALVLPMGAVAAAAVDVPAEATEWTEWVSDDGGPAGRELPAISADGRYVVFVARSSALKGVYIKDRKLPDKKAWQLWAGDAFNPDISADGEYVVWANYGTPKVVYRLEWQDSGAVPEVVSVADDERVPSVVSDYPSISGDGRYVAFQSMDKTLDAEAVPGKSGGGPNKVYVRDTKLGTTEMVSVVDVDTGDQIVNGNAIKPDITPDGRYVAFASDASVLQGIEEDGHEELPTAAAEEEEETATQVYLRDRLAKTTTPVSLASDGIAFGDLGSALEYGPSVSYDGTLVAFESDATNLVSGDTNDDTDAFLRDMTTKSTKRISLDDEGDQVDLPDPDAYLALAAKPGGGGGGGGESEDLTPNVGAGPVVSGDGDFVAFESLAALTPDDENTRSSTCTPEDGETVSDTVHVSDVYRYAVSDGDIDRQSVANDVEGAFEAEGYRIDGMTGLCTPVRNGTDPAISEDGTRVAFVSNGNLSGIVLEEDEDEGEGESDGEAIEPSTFLHRPNPEPDVVAPTSKATGTAYVNTKKFLAEYVAADEAFPSSGVAKVELWLMRPGETRFTKRQVDLADAVDGKFTVLSRVSGKYRYYTVAVDKAGNVEATPAKADAVTKVDLVAPSITKAKVVPSPFDISRDGKAVFKMTVSEKTSTTFLVKRNGVVVKRFATELSPEGLVTQTWRGRTDAGRLVVNGDFVVVMKAQDLAGNASLVRVGLRVTR